MLCSRIALLLLALGAGCQREDSEARLADSQLPAEETQAPSADSPEPRSDSRSESLPPADSAPPTDRGFLGSFGYTVRGGGSYALDSVPVNAERTLEALRASGMTHLGLAAQDGSPGIPCPSREDGRPYTGTEGAGHHWCAMTEILQSVEDSETQVMAVLVIRGVDPTPRWLDDEDGFYIASSCPEEPADGCHHVWSAEARDRFLQNWIDAAEELSRLSLQPGHQALKGFTIDDLDGYICGPNTVGINKQEGCYTSEHLQQIAQAGRSCEGCNPDFQFWASARAVLGAPRTLSGSHILGQLDETMAPAEGVEPDYPVGNAAEVSLELELTLEEVPDSLQLSFLFSDA